MNTMHFNRLVLASLLVLLTTSLAPAQQTFLRIHAGETRTSAASAALTPVLANAPLAVTASVCDEDGMAWYSQPVPGGGTLNPLAFATPANIAGANRIAYHAQVDLSARNQGVFRGNGGVVQPIAIGSGAGGGSGSAGTGVGDPSPIGGRFTGFFGGTPFAPATNDSGDLLFLADVSGGSAPRGLFLYRASTQTIVKVAAVGDVSPTGAVLTEIGPGSINASGTVVFLASRTTSLDNEILRWQNGVLTKIAAVGDTTPNGGSYIYVAGEYFGYVDGTNIPTGPVPDINDSGAIVFRGFATSGSGIVFVPTAGPPQWYVRDGDATPHGGIYGGIWGPVLNNANQIAFYSDVTGGPQSGWFVGKPGSWRKAFVFFDTIDVGPCTGLAVSRNPMQPLDDDGDLTLWASEQLGPNSDRDWLLVSRANGVLVRVAAMGQSTALGGVIGGMDAWPSMRADQCTLSCGTPGAPGIVSAYFLDTLCPSVFTYCTAGTSVNGCSASISGVGTASASAPSGFTIAANGVDGLRAGIVFYGASGAFIQPWGTGGTSLLCVKTPTQRTGVQSSGGTLGNCDGALTLDFNAFRAANSGALGQPMFAGQSFDAQVWYRDPGSVKNTILSDALAFTLAP